MDDVGLAQVRPGRLTLVNRWAGGNRWPCIRAGGVICLRPALRVNTACGGTTLWILVMLLVLLMMVLLITVWLILVTREM